MALVNENVGNTKSGSVECSYYIKFTWKIENFSTLGRNRVSSVVFTGGEHKWGLVVYPEGYDIVDDHVSVFLEVPDDEVGKLPSGWSRRIRFRLSGVNETEKRTVTIGTAVEERLFSERARTWGNQLFLPLDADLLIADTRFLVNDTLTVRAEIWFDGQEKKEEPKVKRPSSIADTVFRDTQSPPKRQQTHRSYTDTEVAAARVMFKTCLNMDMSSLIKSRQVFNLNYSLGLLLDAKAFPGSTVSQTRKFLANLLEHCQKYEAANRERSEAQENKNSIEELKTTLNRLSSDFLPVRNEAEAIHKEIAWYEAMLAEKKTTRRRLMNRLNYFAHQSIDAKQALLCAEHELSKSTERKKATDKTVTEFIKSWVSLKALHFEMITADANSDVNGATDAATRETGDYTP